MRRSRLVIVTLIAAALVALVVLIVKYGPLAPAPSATLPAVTGSSTASAVASSSPAPVASASSSGPASPAAVASPSETAPAAAPTATATASATASATTAKRKVDVVVTFADWSAADQVVEAGAYVKVVEAPGSCTLRLTSGGRSATASIPALTDASTMSCGGLTVPRDKLASGTWTAVVLYESATSAGTSAPGEVVVP